MMKPATMIVASKQWNLDLKKLDKLLAIIDLPKMYDSLEAKGPDTSQQFKYEQATEHKTDDPKRVLCFGQAIPNAIAFATRVIADI